LLFIDEDQGFVQDKLRLGQQRYPHKQVVCVLCLAKDFSRSAVIDKVDLHKALIVLSRKFEHWKRFAHLACAGEQQAGSELQRQALEKSLLMYKTTFISGN
jgi:hypothetical protein